MSSRRIPDDQLGLPLGGPAPIAGKPEIEASCSFCHKKIDLPSWMDTQAVSLRFCSAECRRAWAEETPSFEVRLDGRPGRRGANWEIQARQARQRDGFRCRECGVTEEELGRQLDVHHQIPFSSFKSNLEANKLEHLVSVCPACHAKLEAQLRRELPLFRQS
jgi:5-methylcytosine-specific restriction endonuclease McrA